MAGRIILDLRELQPEAWVSRTEYLAPLPTVALQDWTFTATLPPYSVTTYVISN